MYVYSYTFTHIDKDTLAEEPGQGRQMAFPNKKRQKAHPKTATSTN
jgi:hypothetical protein